MIDKQKLLQWIEDKKYVFSEPFADENDEMKCEGSLEILRRLSVDIQTGEFDA